MKCKDGNDLDNEKIYQSVMWRPDTSAGEPPQPFITNCPGKNPRTHKLFAAPPQMPEGPNRWNPTLDSYIRAGETGIMEDKNTKQINMLDRSMDVRLPSTKEYHQGYVDTLDFRSEYTHLKKTLPSQKDRGCPV